MEVTPVRKPVSRKFESFTPVLEEGCRRRVLPRREDDQSASSGAKPSDVAVSADCSMGSSPQDDQSASSGAKPSDVAVSKDCSMGCSPEDSGSAANIAKPLDVADSADCSMGCSFGEHQYPTLLAAISEEHEPIESKSTLAEDEAPILVTRAEAGKLEFEFDGQIYRVHDTAAFGTIIGTSALPKRQSLGNFRRAQRLARQSEALDAKSAARDGQPGCSDESFDFADRNRGAASKTLWEDMGPSLASELGIP
eukprot:TRINITY_DN19102_c0_g1_i1.p1 TRINITY_DN19102_c0_g1~~TRINITY_DN19102_c0_g1_i1.p1  ORF type:complete len:273 (+),score=45.80 TRINITY_DN19102_c0_g1_i1:65-820(+)